MLYTIDRVQYIKTNNRYYVYEFMEVSNIHALILEDDQLPFQNAFWNTLENLINDVEKSKIEFLKENIQAIKIFIFYQRKIDKYIKIEINPFSNVTSGCIWDFVKLQKWFRKLNNIDGDSSSKGLGAVRDTDVDSYVNGILQSLYNNNQFHDDNGLNYTKNILDNDSTKGLDEIIYIDVDSNVNGILQTLYNNN